VWTENEIKASNLIANDIYLREIGWLFPDGSYSTTILCKGVVIDFKSYTGTQFKRGDASNEYQAIYAVSYVYIGIPIKMYEWMLNRVNEAVNGSFEYNEPRATISQDHAWVVAKLIRTQPTPVIGYERGADGGI